MTQDDIHIIQALREGTEDGFRRLMRLYQQPVYWHIRRLVVRHDMAEDATQETFIRIFRGIGQFNAHTSLRAWIFRIASNEALRLLARQRDGQVSLEAAKAETGRMEADEYIDYSDLEAVRLQKAILSLPTKQQMAFNLRYYDEMSYDEIAQATDSTASAAKMNYHIAREKIVRYMQTHE